MLDRKLETMNKKYNKDEMIKACLDQKLFESNDRQQAAINIAIEAAEKNEPLSIQLIKNIHASFTNAVEWDPYKSPEWNEEANESGEFRNSCVGTNPKDTLTEDGISEILKLIQKEKQDGFPQYKGTYLVPIHHRQPDYSRSVDHTNVTQKSLECPEGNLAKKLHNDSKSEPLVIIFSRTNDNKLSIKKYIEKALSKMILEFNKEIAIAKNNDEKIKIITSFIKQCLRLHPFNNGNHRVFALSILNYLLLKNDIGYCPLKDRRQFIGVGLDESLKEIKEYLVPLQPEPVLVIDTPKVTDGNLHLFALKKPDSDKDNNDNLTQTTSLIKK